MDITNAYIPVVREFSPTEFSADVALRPEITTVFSLDMKVGGIADAQEADTYLNSFIVLANRETDAPIQVELTAYDPKTYKLSFTPVSDLDPSTTYTITILAGFEASTGRSMASDYSWTFTTAESAISGITLTGPIDKSEVAAVPILSWDPVSDQGITYHVQVSLSPQFLITAYDITGLSETLVNTLSPTVISAGVVCYWRVRAESDTASGPWSETRSFKVKSSELASTPRSVFGAFGLTSYYPQNGASGLIDWPSIRLDFTHAIDPNSVATGVGISAVNVDTGVAGTVPTILPTVSGSAVNIALTGTMVSNTRYTVTVLGIKRTDGAVLENPTSFGFSAGYSPVYGSALALRTSYGAFLSEYTDDEVTFQLHRSSVKCNRLLDSVAGTDTSTTASLLVQRDATYDMEWYTQAHATYSLIQAYQFKMLAKAGRTQQVDTFVINVDRELLAKIQSILKTLGEELKQAELSIRGGAPAPISGVRSSSWDPSSMESDLSITNITRGTF